MKLHLLKLLRRNRYSRRGKKLPRNYVHLEYYDDAVNLGDHLSLVVCEYMLSLRGLTFADKSYNGKTLHLSAIGSILGGRGDFDVTVWGSGIRTFGSVCSIKMKKLYTKNDIRAVRGPMTREAYIQCGLKCPKIYGDPAVLMPLIYTPKPSQPLQTVLITHYLTPQDEHFDVEGMTYLNIQTTDYASFIDQLASAKKVISSSLHGIFLHNGIVSLWPIHLKRPCRQIR